MIDYPWPRCIHLDLMLADYVHFSLEQIRRNNGGGQAVGAMILWLEYSKIDAVCRSRNFCLACLWPTMIRHATRDNDPSVSCNSPFYVKLFFANQSYNSGSLTDYNSLIWPVIKGDVFLDVFLFSVEYERDTDIWHICLFYCVIRDEIEEKFPGNIVNWYDFVFPNNRR